MCPILPLGIIMLTNIKLYYLMMLLHKLQIFWPNDEKIFKYFSYEGYLPLPNCSPALPTGFMISTNLNHTTWWHIFLWKFSTPIMLPPYLLICINLNLHYPSTLPNKLYFSGLLTHCQKFQLFGQLVFEKKIFGNYQQFFQLL